MLKALMVGEASLYLPYLNQSKFEKRYMLKKETIIKYRYPKTKSENIGFLNSEIV